MSRQSAKRSKATAMASAGVLTIDSLPPELFETVFGFLDVGTLCTARLVCAHFRNAASSCIHSLVLSVETLRNRPDTTFNNFPNLSRVTVVDVERDDLLVLAQSPVADAVTHLRAVDSLSPLPQSGHTAAGLLLLRLPNLTSLAVGYTFKRVPFPQTLRELVLKASVSLETAHLVTGLRNLTCLRVDFRRMPNDFEAVTALTALQRLEIWSELSLIPFVAELTLLTHLQLGGKWGPASLSDLAPLASLSRLHRLVHLGVKRPGVGYLRADLELELETRILASTATFTSLRSLDLDLCSLPGESAFETACMAPFSQLTALRVESLGLDASFLPRFDLERLRDLSLSRWVELDWRGVEALGRATCLTHLELWEVDRTVERELGTALSRLSQLRALTLGTTDAFRTMICPDAIGLLTELTRLLLSGRGLTTNADVEACLGLKKLRVLSVLVGVSAPAPWDRITPETFFAIAKLPELRKFVMTGKSDDLGHDGRAWLNAERHEKGWPPLDLHLSL